MSEEEVGRFRQEPRIWHTHFKSCRLVFRHARARPALQRICHPPGPECRAFLGQIPNPQTGAKSVNLRAAKSVIDSLEMLASKTRGNLTVSEEKLISTALQNLKPLYQAAQDS